MERHPIRRKPGHPTSYPQLLIPLLLALALVLCSCRPDQIGAWFGARGVHLSSAEAVQLADAHADRLARTNGARGTCSEAGIWWAEGGGDWHAQNPRSSASGGYQFLDGTWAGHRGYRRARDAPPWVQRERFLQTWDAGRGARHWAESVC